MMVSIASSSLETYSVESAESIHPKAMSGAMSRKSDRPWTIATPQRSSSRVAMMAHVKPQTPVCRVLRIIWITPRVVKSDSSAGSTWNRPKTRADMRAHITTDLRVLPKRARNEL